jgi:hypothetical protein
MKSVLRQLAILVMGVAVLAQGQTATPPTGDQLVRPVELISLPQNKRNRVNLSYRMGLNITADFKKLGGLAAVSNPGAPTGGAVDRTYDNGYNLVDVTGNDHGPGFQNTTWNWGYQNAGALQGNQLVFTSSSSPATASSKDNSNDPQHGVELGYGRELFQKGKWRFGMESGLGYSRLSIGDNRTLMGTVNQITDTYAVPTGVVVPPAPYNGTFNGPGAVIGSAPGSRTTTVISQGATIVGKRSIDANIYSLRIGPYAEVPLNDRFSLLFNGGLYLAIGDTRFKFQETVTLPGTGTEVHSGSGSQTDFLIGGYVGGNVEYALSKDLALFVGAQFQGTGRPVNREQGKEAILNLNQSVIVSIGASYSF